MSVTNFYLEKRADKNGEHPITLSVSIRGTRLLSTVGFNVPVKAWTGARVKQGTTTARGIPYNIINLRIKEIDAAFEGMAATIDRKPTVDELAEKLASIKGAKRKAQKEQGEERPSIITMFDEFVREESFRSQWADGTVKCMDSFKTHLLKMGCKEPSYFNESGIKRLITYFRDTCGMGEDSVRKHYKHLKWFLNWCIRKGYTTETAILRYRPRFRMMEKPVIFLTKEELSKLYHFQIPANGTKVKLTKEDGTEYEKEVEFAGALEKTRDLFCFCAYTGLRYSDMAKLRKSDRFGDAITITTKKTSDKLTIPLNNHSRAILDKYKDTMFPDGLALPVLSNQKMNCYIKDLGELCGFNETISRVMVKGGEMIEIEQPKWELLGTHAGRRTFICYALSMGIAPQVVMKFTGHRDYKAMKPYIEIEEKTRDEAMKLFDTPIGKEESE